MIVLLRIDHRLLHGQVAFSWTKSISTDCKVSNEKYRGFSKSTKFRCYRQI